MTGRKHKGMALVVVSPDLKDVCVCVCVCTCAMDRAQSYILPLQGLQSTKTTRAATCGGDVSNS